MPTPPLFLNNREVSNQVGGNQVVHGDVILNSQPGLSHSQLDHLLDVLPYVHDAGFDYYDRQQEPKCLPETRVDLLHSVMEWADDATDQCIFWLNGMAGTGKSTIARTVAQRFADQERLAASFFFTKGGGDLGHARNFFTTIAIQLATVSPLLRDYICEEVRNRPDIARKAMSEQWKRLIFHPLYKFRDRQSPPYFFILVVDALDECDDQEDIQQMLRVFAATKDLTTVKLRILVTSRPETSIRLEFQDIGETLYRHVELQNISRSVIEHDISAFLTHELAKIRKLNRLPASWLGEQRMRLLVEKADGLFIYAATACLFIRGKKGTSPRRRLSQLLEGKAPDRSSTQRLDEMYMRILRDSVSGDYSDSDRDDITELTEQFRRAVGTIVVLFDSLSVASLAGLLYLAESEQEDIFPESTIQSTLDPLYSVLVVPEILRCSDMQFWVDEKLIHFKLAETCLEVMSKNLKKNICGLESPGSLTSDVEKDVLVRCLPSHLQYACRYWVEHLERGSFEIRDGGTVPTFLKRHLLNWLEALSLIGRLSDGLSMVTKLEVLLTHDRKSGLFAFVHDAKRFILSYRSMLEKTPLQIYSSAIIFSPRSSEIRKLFLDQVPGWIRLLPHVEEQWGACVQTLEGHSNSVTVVVFSPDGRLVASGSWDNTVRLWDATTGESRGTFKGHSGGVSAVVFSPDGRLMASGSHDLTVRLWDATTGESRGALEDHSSSVQAVVFSPDGRLAASGSHDKTVRLWDATTGESRGTLKGHSDGVVAVVFSPDGRLVASGSHDHTVRLWGATTGESRGTLKGHSSGVAAVVFSPNGRLVASGSYDKTVRLWDATTGESRGTLKGHSNGVLAVLFSPNGRLVASGSYDKTVRLWDIDAQETVRTAEFGLYDQLSFNPDSSCLTFSRQSGQRISLDATRQWISSKKNNILWIPHDRRPGKYEVRDNVIVLGGQSSRMTFLSFDLSANLSI